jgi:alpha-L-arabinofuranosidase
VPVQGQVLSATAMDAHKRFDEPAAMLPVPFAAAPREGVLRLALPPKAIVVVSASR